MAATSQALTSFKAPQATLKELSADAAARLIEASADIALILDENGTILDLAFGKESAPPDSVNDWRGQKWLDVVTIESREKVADLLRDASSNAEPRWRQLNHPLPQGADLPVRYTTLRVGDSGAIIAIGRDLRAMAKLQRRLVEAQQSMEREYSRLRH